MTAYYILTPIGEEKPKIDQYEFLIAGGEKYDGYLSQNGKFYANAMEIKNVTHWLKPVNPVEALIEKYEKELEAQEGNIKKFLATSLYEIKKRIIKQFINDLKNI